MANLEKLNSLVADLTTEIESAKDEAGVGEEEELPPEEEGFGEETPEEGMEEEMPEEGEEETPFPPKKKKKPFPPKEM